MLSAFRHRACRARPQCFPRYSRPLTTGTATTDREEAMNVLGLSPKQDLDTAPTPDIAPQVDLSNMHHNIPPASSPLLQFMTTLVMRHGEYAKAAKTVSQMLLHIYSLTRSPPMPIVERAVEIASPVVRSRRMKQGGGKTGYVPQALNDRQRMSRGIKWIRDESGKKGKPGKTYAERLARQVIAIVNGHEPTNKFKEDIHRLAMVNRYEVSNLEKLSFLTTFLSRGVLPKR